LTGEGRGGRVENRENRNQEQGENAMTIELTPEHQRMIERVMHSGGYHEAQDVISAALEALAEDVDDVAVMKAREHEPRVSLDEAEVELRTLGKLK